MRLGVREVARLLTVSEDDVFRWIRRRDIPHSHVYEHYWFNSIEVLEWATGRGMHVAMDVLAEESPGLPRLSDALEVGGVHHDVPGSGREPVLRGVVERLALPPNVDKDLVVDMLLARDDLGFTAAGEGIVFPQVRSPIVLAVGRAGVALCFLREPLALGALGREPVTAVFLSITPTVKAHLHLLSRVAQAVRDERFKKALSARAPRDEILAEARRVEDRLTRREP